MGRTWRPKSSRAGLRDERVLLTTVLLVASAPAVGSVVLIMVSTHPSMLYQRFSHTIVADAPMPVDWTSLELLGEDEHFANEHHEMLDAPVRVPGYMLPSDENPDEHGVLSRFLLVPDPGNWLHPPHLDPGEVIVVNMEGRGKTRFYEGKAVWVAGRLAREPLKTRRFLATLQMTATSVQLFAESK